MVLDDLIAHCLRIGQTIRKSLLPWWVVCPAEALLFLSLGVVSFAKRLSINPVLPGIQGDYRREKDSE
jgi:hypothetical protein